MAQRKIPVVLYPVHQNPRFHGQKLILILFVHKNRCFRGQGRHKAYGASPLGVARAACFEQLAGVFASCGALHYAKILASLKIKNGISLTPLNRALNAFTFALNDSADAFVERLVVKYRLIVVYERLQNSVKALQLHLVYSIIPPCQFSHLRSAFRAQCIQSILSNCKRTAKAAVNVERSFEMPFQPPVKDSDTNPFNFQNNTHFSGSSLLKTRTTSRITPILLEVMPNDTLRPGAQP